MRSLTLWPKADPANVSDGGKADAILPYAGLQSDGHELDASDREDLIDGARRVDLVVVSADGGSLLSIATLAISSGSPVLTVDPRKGPSAGETIRDQAGALGADLVVMGSYGRSRLQEVILGGASREMSMHGAMPLLTNR